ncbi:MAG: DNA-binding response regulator, partial [Propionibacteriaceae bacterium]|nr:DNA-binding response regulator [Propionibacteriaceae bacterium]
MRLVVAEDSVLLREGLVRLLEEAGHEVVAAVGGADALIEAVPTCRPDLVVT